MKQSLVFWILTIAACQSPAPEKLDSAALSTTSRSVADTSITEALAEQSPQLVYSWLSAESPIESTLYKEIAVPAGYERVSVEAGSFGEWLRYLPLLPKGAKVMLHNGSEKSYQDGAFRVVNIDIGKADLQQCADAIMRLKAEYHYGRKEYADIHFNYTSGDRVSFDDWRKGRQPKLSSGKVVFSSPTGTTDNSYANFQKYLKNVFMYAGTASLEKELKPKNLSEIAAGDVFIKGGFPGHAVLVLDVAQHKTSGERIFLLAQSYMPAQSIHVLKNLNDAALSPWYSIQLEKTDYQLLTPEWTFAENSLRTW